MARPGRPILLLLAALVLAMLGAACSTLTVRHLARAPWSVAPGQALAMKYWSFAYDVAQLPDRYGITGRATPTAEVPDWVAYASELWFEAYLCDADGRVLARDSRIYQARSLDRTLGIPFEFILKPFPPQGKDAKLFVTFGYSMNAADRAPADPAASAPPRVFFANESALSRF
jgi:hypothetical protein